MIQKHYKYFPDTQVIDMQNLTIIGQSNPLLAHFFCKVVPSAAHACQAARSNEIGKVPIVNANVYHPLDYDRLATSAYEQNLLGFQQVPNSTAMARSQVTAVIVHRSRALNQTLNDLPQTCVANETLESIWNLSVVMDKMFLSVNHKGAPAWIETCNSCQRAVFE